MSRDELYFLGVDLNRPFFDAVSDYGLGAASTLLFIEYMGLLRGSLFLQFLAFLTGITLVRVFRQVRGRDVRYEDLIWIGTIPLFLVYIVFMGFRVSWKWSIPRQLGFYYRFKKFLKNKIPF
jgi:hypothetical protein